MIDPAWNLRKSLTLEFGRILFHSEHSIELLDQEDRVMEHNTRRVMKHNPILQGGMSLMRGRKSCMGTWEVSFFQRSRYLRFSAVNASFIVSCALHPFINLGMRFLLRREGCSTPCYGCPNYHHLCLNHASNPLVNQVLIKLMEILLFSIQTFNPSQENF
jgi:hypothetical protein